MRPLFPSARTLLGLMALLAISTVSGFADALSQDIEPAEANIGDQVIVSYTIQNGSANDLQLPAIDGLQVVGSRTFSSIVFSNGTLSRTTTFKYAIVASRAGTFIIPPFDIHTNEGGTLHVKAMKLLIYDNSSTSATNNAAAPTAPSAIPNPNTAANPNPAYRPIGPVVQPPPNAVVVPATPNNVNPAAGTDANLNIPQEPDGSPAKVFIIITPESTDAYVGQSVEMRIDFFIRMDVVAEQNSLPTINGSNFLMNAFITRGRENIVLIENEQYGRETWLTAISAPKSGDFPLSMVRDTYWVKSITNGNTFDPFAFFNRRQNLAHLPITSNLLTMHIHPLPDEGRPDHFSGAIGQFQITSNAHPSSVAIGEPVTLDFSVSGAGNFDYVRCPTLPEDPAWKQYIPSSKIDYRDEAHTQAVKTFRQSIIPQKNGDLPLPAASFSYFNPNTKQYVTVPVTLPVITVTGALAPLASNPPAADSDATSVAAGTPTAELLPNRIEIGSPRLSLIPVYRQPWFWVAQGGLLTLPLLGGLLFFIRARQPADDGSAERTRRRHSLQQEEDAMAEAVRGNDAVAFFIAARHAVQLQLGAQWRISPEALTLGEIRSRDERLAETLEPLFAQADEVIYSGQAQPGVDLAQWENRVRTELLQPQPA